MNNEEINDTVNERKKMQMQCRDGPRMGGGRSRGSDAMDVRRERREKEGNLGLGEGKGKLGCYSVPYPLLIPRRKERPRAF